MNKKQLIFIGAAVVLVAALYLFGDFRGPVKKAPDQAGMRPNSEEHDHESDTTSLDIKSYETQCIARLDANKQSQVRDFMGAAEKLNKPESYRDLAEFWEKQKDLNLAAFYYKRGAFLENTEKSVTFAGNLFLAILQRTDKPDFRRWQAREAIEIFNKALEINPSNLDSKIALATCYTEGTGETMKGVTLLREVTQQDSNNVSANIILGKLAIQSGQLDKAIRRLEHVLMIEPKNTEAMYFLAEAYKNQGNKAKAIELFENCKRIVNSPDFSKEIDNYIATFK
ncbi:MAG: tetratricopeptide repeat protein [Chitinophagaceae bacterium]|nr:tetratricopeptide repeat protein [Chitinophagaceae bacterium]